MIKLVICILCALVIGAACLQLRQQQLELRSRLVVIQDQIERQQSRLWSQQMQISVYTSPPAVAKVAGELPLAPEAGLPGKAGDWLRE
jgi:hypothetical protein